MKFNKSWLTLTHSCNFNCEWCYDKNNVNNKYMDWKLVTQIIKFLHEIECNNINLIGGEPTLHPDLEKIIEYATGYDMSTTLVTNGTYLSDDVFVECLLEKGLKNVYLSYKGKDNIEYQIAEDDNFFEKIIKALENLDNHKIDYIIDLVITSQNINEIYNWIRDIRKYSDATIHLSICKPAIGIDGITNLQYVIEPNVLISKFQNLYINNKDFSEEKFVLHQTLPLCLWDENIIKQLKEKNQIGMGCQLLCRDGIIFDVNGELMLCNGLSEFPYGKFGESFINKETMLDFYNKENIKHIFNEMCRFPDAVCDTCKKRYQCGGGCAIQWFSYSFSQINIGKE